MAGDLRQYPPTARRLRRLQQAGLFPYSQVLTVALILLTTLITATLAGSVLLESLQNLMRGTLGQARLNMSAESLDHSTLLPLGLLVAGWLLVIWVVAVLVAGLQRGFTGSSGGPRLLPWGQAVSFGPRPRSRDLAWELIVAAAIVGGAALIIFGNVRALATVPPAHPTPLLNWVRHIALGFGWRFAALLVGLGLCDYLYQRAVFGQLAAMTRQELEDEIRETEGPWLARWWRRQRLGRR